MAVRGPSAQVRSQPSSLQNLQGLPVPLDVKAEVLSVPSRPSRNGPASPALLLPSLLQSVDSSLFLSLCHRTFARALPSVWNALHRDISHPCVLQLLPTSAHNPALPSPPPGSPFAADLTPSWGHVIYCLLYVSSNVLMPLLKCQLHRAGTRVCPSSGA